MTTKDPVSVLEYPFACQPQGAERVTVAPGVDWLRLPLPFSLDHINVWLMGEGSRRSIVDTGLSTSAVRERWEAIFLAEPSMGIDRVIVTHLHPDHVGSAGWLCERWNCELMMSRTDYLLTRMLTVDRGPPPPEAIAFYQAAGFDEAMLASYSRSFGNFGSMVSPLPAGFRRLQQDDVIQLGEQSWRILIGRGHAPEHACLYCEESNVLIAGDQLLPRISSNVSVWPYEPEENPLQDWLTSCRMLIETMPSDVLVLPAHNEPFHGAHDRLRAIIEEHEERLEALEAFCVQPKRVIDTFEVLFGREISGANRVMAAGESIAHFNWLRANDRVTKSLDRKGVAWYERCA